MGIREKKTVNADLVEKRICYVRKKVYEIKHKDHKEILTSEEELDMKNRSDRRKLLDALISGRHIITREDVENAKMDIMIELTKILEDLYEELPFH